MSAFTTIAAISLFLIGQRISLTVFLMSEFGIGFCQAGGDVVTNAWIVQLWSHKSYRFLQTIYFVNIITAMIATLIIAPFLSQRNKNQLVHGTRIAVPFSTTAAMLLFIALLFLITRSCMTNEEVSGIIRPEEVGEKIPTSRSFTFVAILTCCLTNCLMTVFLNTITYLPKFLTANPAIDSQTAAFMLSATQASTVMTGGLGIFAAARVRGKTIISSVITVLTIGNLLMLFFARLSVTWTWISCLLMGFGCSSIIPSILSLVSEKMTVDDSICSLLISTGNLTFMLASAILGTLIDQHAVVFLAINLTCLLVAPVFLFLFVNTPNI